jgi:hypothetical protein
MTALDSSAGTKAPPTDRRVSSQLDLSSTGSETKHRRLRSMRFRRLGCRHVECGRTGEGTDDDRPSAVLPLFSSL